MSELKDIDYAVLAMARLGRLQFKRTIVYYTWYLNGRSVMSSVYRLRTAGCLTLTVNRAIIFPDGQRLPPLQEVIIEGRDAYGNPVEDKVWLPD